MQIENNKKIGRPKGSKDSKPRQRQDKDKRPGLVWVRVSQKHHDILKVAKQNGFLISDVLNFALSKIIKKHGKSLHLEYNDRKTIASVMATSTPPDTHA